ncbi:MAG TPA: hypothetical protein VN654_25525 [Vicinamibacterales bacterium]|jgi:hypothetical protein|nr:hypothetical protein [Vicinamibacterales bacterium]
MTNHWISVTHVEILEGRLKNEGVNVFTEVRRRLESGPPPE